MRNPAVGDEIVNPSAVDALLVDSSVLVVIGPGGVGKTTMAASLAARAAQVHGRRALVVTVDPARRLADALGISDFAEDAVLVPVGSDRGRLWALMVDMGQSWDRLVARHAPNDEVRDQLLANRLYRSLTEKFVQSHDYIALDRLVDLTAQDSYDLVVIDTPPSVHALGVLDAPDRMIEFFGSRFLTWLTAPYRNRLVRAAASPFLAVAERLLGGPFLAEVADFFWLFSRLQPDFVRRAREVKRTLEDPTTRYVMVQTTEARPAARARELSRALEARGFEPSLVVVNRAPDPAIVGLTELEIAAVVDPELRAGILALGGGDRIPNADGGVPQDGVPHHRVPTSRTATDSVSGLVDLLDGPRYN